LFWKREKVTVCFYAVARANEEGEEKMSIG
jgi:hypothetical protein